MAEALDQLLELLHLFIAILLSQLVAMPEVWMKKLYDVSYLSLITISPTNKASSENGRSLGSASGVASFPYGYSPLSAGGNASGMEEEAI